MQPLEGIRVLEVAQFNAGPGVGMYLADQGAEVIKVERPPSGDPMREMGATPFLKGLGRAFMVLNRNKRSLAVDINAPEGREVLHQLAQRADVFIENFRPGGAERMGLGYDELSALNPRLVYASVSAYGPRGPHAGRPGYDRIVQGVAGLQSRRMPDGRPIPVGISATDLATPMAMAYGITLALWMRYRTGKGQRVEGSLLHTYLALQLGNMLYVEDDAVPFRSAGETPSGIYRCGDGRYINVTVHTIQQLRRLCQAAGLTELLKDARLAGHALTRELQEDVLSAVEKVLESAPSREWLARLEALDVPCGPILETGEVFQEPQVVANEMLVTVEHPRAGRTQMVAPPVRLSDMPSAVRRPAPEVGEHTGEILRELGYSQSDIDELNGKQVILLGNQKGR